MTKEVLKILQCPICGGSLILNTTLNCENCGANFPIVDDIMVFLTSENLQEFLREPWGKELLKDEFGKFISSTHNVSEIQKTVEQVESEALKKHKDYAIPDLNFPKELSLAIEKSRELLAEKANIKTAHRILDWPTGGGFFLEYLVKIVSEDALIIAIDINFGQLAVTKAYLDKIGKGKNIIFVVSDARNMPFKDNIFQAVTAWGGIVEIPKSQRAVKESYRVMEKNGWFGISGDLYKENSESFRIAKKLNLEAMATKERLKKVLQKTGFKNLSYEIVYEGYDTETKTPPEEHCPLPAPGDWFSHIVATGQRI